MLYGYGGYYKMKNFVYFVIGLLVISSISYAETVSSTRAVSIAQNWYYHFNPAPKTGTRISSVKNVQTEQYKKLDTFYIINMTDRSFVLVSAQDITFPVLGYSFDAEMDQATINPAARAWLDDYSRQIAQAVSLGKTNTYLRDEWQSLENNIFPTTRGSLDVPAMPPLLSIKWNQYAPYNTFTPEDSVTGCVATAMAQIMKYHNYPEFGSGQNSYVHETYGALSADFNIAYQWNHMPNKISASSDPVDISAVATIMYHAGVSVNMDYAPDGSSASVINACESLQNYFGYSASASHIDKSNYTDQEWANILIKEINAFRPVLYSGENPSGGGHAFICDGYQGTDYFHFNWGWGGYCDGYYRIVLLDPSDRNYTDNQDAIIGIQPGKKYERPLMLSNSFEDTFPSEGFTQAVVISGTASPKWIQVSAGSNPSCTPPDGEKMLQFNANTAADGSEARLIVESIDLSHVSYPKLTFMMYHDNSYSSKETEGIQIQISENGIDWTDLDFYPRYTMYTGWKAYHIDLTYYTGKIIHIGFLGHSGLGSNIYIDKIEINYAGPTSGMIAETLVSYVGANISYTDDSFNASSYLWDFGDSTIVTTKNASHIFSSPGIYTITHTVDNTSSTSQRIHVLPVVIPPYLPEDGGNFENNFLDFETVRLEGDLNIWELGKPGNTISTTHSGFNVWKTDLDSNIDEGNYTCALYTPGFDLTKIGNFYLKFYYRMETNYSNSPGAAWLEYSTDLGKQWHRLGDITDNPSGTENWYNKDNNGVALDGICWWKTKTEYTQAVYNLSNFLGTSAICFRFIYKVESGWNDIAYEIDGFAIDDFTLEYVGPEADFQTPSNIIYTDEPIQFIDKSTFTQNWTWHFGDKKFSTDQHPVHAYSVPGEYTVTLSINDNSSIKSRQIFVLPTLKPPYTSDDGGNFESNPLHFTSTVIAGDSNLWERGVPSNIISDTASGTTVWKTDLDANIQKADYTCVLYTPNFNFSKSGDYYLKFKFRMNRYYNNAPAAAWLEYSTDQGEIWQKLGSSTGNPSGTENWYDNDDNDVAPDGICWWQNKSQYTQAVYNLSEFAKTKNISFRFVFMVQGNWQGGYDIDGWAIDDFEIEHPTKELYKVDLKYVIKVLQKISE